MRTAVIPKALGMRKGHGKTSDGVDSERRRNRLISGDQWKEEKGDVSGTAK